MVNNPPKTEAALARENIEVTIKLKVIIDNPNSNVNIKKNKGVDGFNDQ